MNAQPSRTLRAKQKRKNKKFLWHLEPPWRVVFSHDHWWKKTKTETQAAIVWEVFRRHPKTLRRNQKFCKEYPLRPLPSGLWKTRSDINQFGFDPSGKLGINKVSDLLFFWRHDPLVTFSGFCRYSWPELAACLQELWTGRLAEMIPPQNGIPLAAVRVLNRKKLTQEEIECLLPEFALDEDQRGMMIIAVDPNGDKVGEAVENLVDQWNGSRRNSRGKSHAKAWFKIIAKFETAELKRGANQNRDDQDFLQYRRVMSKWCWDRPEHLERLAANEPSTWRPKSVQR